MTVFYLVRHAHAEWAPDEQRPLSVKGHEGAQRVAELLCDLPITRIYSSPFQRALQTVAPLASRLSLSILREPDLRERTLGDVAGVNDFFAAVMKAWQEPTFSHPGGETNVAAQLRGIAVLERLQKEHNGEHLILSTHGNLLTLVLQHYDRRIDYGFWKALTMPDIYILNLPHMDEPTISRLWKER